MRIFTGKCAISQNGSGAGYWQVAVTNFNDPGGQFDTTEIQAGDFLIFTDSGDFYQLEVTEVVSASGSNATVKVSNVGVTGISSVPTTTNAAVSRGSTNYELIPWISNISANENQLFTEDLMVKIDEALDSIAGGGGGPTNLSFTGASTPYSLNSSTGTGVTIAAGSGVTLSRVGDELTITASGGGGGATDLTFSGSASPFTLNSSTGTDVTFASGSNVTLSRSGNQLTVSAPNAITGVTDLINGLDITNTGGNITVAPNIPELTSVGTAYDALDQVMIYDNSAGNHKAAAMGTYLGSGFVDLTNNQTNIAGIKGFTTTLQRGSGSLPTGSTFGSTTGTVFFLAGSGTNMTDNNFVNGSGFAINTHIPSPDINKQTTYFTATGNDTGNDAGEFVFRTSVGGSSFVNAVKINPQGRLMTMRGTGVDASSGGDIIVGNDGLGFEGQAINYVFKTVAATGQEFVLTEAGGAKCYTGVGSSQWTFPSDERLKQNIEELSVLDKLDILKGVTYELKSDGIKQIGVIAQDIQKAFPHGVREADGYLGVGAMTVAAIALQGVKELHEENKMLKQQLQNLLSRVEALENK